MIIPNFHCHFTGKKELKLLDHEWVSFGCPEKHRDEDMYQVPIDSKHGVACCSINGDKCSSENKNSATNEICQNATFAEAKQICKNKEEKGRLRLCFPEELNSCCNGGCEQTFDDQTVWVETSAKGTEYHALYTLRFVLKMPILKV